MINKNKSTLILSNKMLDYWLIGKEQNVFEDAMKDVALDFLEWALKNGYFKPTTAASQYGDELFEMYNKSK